jgi:acyl dehydratase
MTERYLEDFAVGQTYGSGRLRIDEERIKRFASEFDPQPFHLDAAAAQHTIFHGLVASGWHTAAVTCASWSRANSGLQAGSSGGRLR